MTQIIVDFCRFWKKKWWQNLTFHFLPFYPNSNLAIFFLFSSNFTNLFCFLSNSNSANFISFVSLSNCNFQFFSFFGSTFCLPWTTKILFLVIHLKTGRWPKTTSLGVTIPTRHRLSSTNQNWQSYWTFTLPKTWCSWPNISHFRENLKYPRQHLFFNFISCGAFLLNLFQGWHW